MLLPPSHFASPFVVITPVWRNNEAAEKEERRVSPFCAVADPLQAYRDAVIRRGPTRVGGEAATRGELAW